MKKWDPANPRSVVTVMFRPHEYEALSSFLSGQINAGSPEEIWPGGTKSEWVSLMAAYTKIMGAER